RRAACATLARPPRSDALLRDSDLRDHDALPDRGGGGRLGQPLHLPAVPRLRLAYLDPPRELRCSRRDNAPSRGFSVRQRLSLDPTGFESGATTTGSRASATGG